MYTKAVSEDTEVDTVVGEGDNAYNLDDKEAEQWVKESESDDEEFRNRIAVTYEELNPWDKEFEHNYEDWKAKNSKFTTCYFKSNVLIFHGFDWMII